ncbi:PRG3 protein, partial [Erythrocercus mccallii]|nr:PRG3 protein [Erythrocercus mccallii]
MWPCLLLALALLGTVPASHPAPRQLQGGPAGETAQPRYTVVVRKLRTYAGAQDYCQNVYQGQLASVHSSARNQELQKLAKTYNIFISPWIGAVTSRRAGKWESYWEDSSPWNYANWAPTQPLHIVTTCTTLSVRDGLWRSHFCFQLRPFICQY